MRSLLPSFPIQLLLGLALLLPACQAAPGLPAGGGPTATSTVQPAALEQGATESRPTTAESTPASTRAATPTQARPTASASPSPTSAPTSAPTASPIPSPTPQPLGLKIQKSPGDPFETVFSIPIGLQGVHYSGVGVYGAQKSGPQAFTIAPDGSFYVADTIGNRVLHYGSGGLFLEVIDLTGQVQRLMDLAAGPDGLYLLDLGGSLPQLLFLPAGSEQAQNWPLPDSIAMEIGLDGLALDEAGGLLFESSSGSLIGWDGLEDAEPQRLEGYPAGGQVYRAEFPNLMAGDLTVPLTYTTGLGSLHLLAVFPQGGFIVQQEDVLSLDAAHTDTLVHYFDAEGNRLGAARVPTKNQYLPVAHSLAVAPDGQVYWMQTRLDSVGITRLLFYTQLSPP